MSIMVDYQERSAGRYWSETLERVEGCAHSKPAAMFLCRTHVYQGCSGVKFLSLLTCKVKEPICDRARAAAVLFNGVLSFTARSGHLQSSRRKARDKKAWRVGWGTAGLGTALPRKHQRLQLLCESCERIALEQVSVPVRIVDHIKGEHTAV